MTVQMNYLAIIEEITAYGHLVLNIQVYPIRNISIILNAGTCSTTKFVFNAIFINEIFFNSSHSKSERTFLTLAQIFCEIVTFC